MAQPDQPDPALGLTAEQLLFTVNVLEQAKYRGKASERTAAHEAHGLLLERLRALRSDLGFNESARRWYLGDPPPVTYGAYVQSNGGGGSGLAPAGATEVRRMTCSLCGDSTEFDDASTVVHVLIRTVDQSRWWSLGAHVWCLPDGLLD